MTEQFRVDEDQLTQADPERVFLPMLAEYPYLMSPKQVAEFTGLTEQGVRKLLSTGALKGSRAGKKWIIPKLWLLRYLQGNCNMGEDQHESTNL